MDAGTMAQKDIEECFACNADNKKKFQQAVYSFQ